MAKLTKVKKSKTIVAKKSATIKAIKKSTKTESGFVKSPKNQIKSNKKPNLWQRFLASRRNFLRRRPHRSFRLSHRSQTYRSLEIKGYITFSLDVLRQIKQGKHFFVKLLIFTLLLFATLSFLMPQSTYNNLREVLNETTKNSEGANALYRASLLFLSSLTANDPSNSSGQSAAILLILLLIIIWLAVVYFLRHQLAGKAARFSEVIYNCSAPLVSTIILLVFVAIQLTPVNLYLIIFSAARNAQILNGGAVEMLVVFLGVLIFSLVLYWITSTIIALVLVTVRGTRPVAALRVAGDLVVGRRSRIVKRLLWHFLQVIMFVFATLLPIILLENTLATHWEWIKKVPIVPFFLAVESVVVMIWTSAYIYLLYRKILDDKSEPA